MTELEMGDLVSRVLRPWKEEVSDAVCEDFWEVLKDLPDAAIKAGADQLCQYRMRSEGAPAPGDWRIAAERFLRESAPAGPERARPAVSSPDEAAAVLDRLRRGGQ